MDNKKDIKLKIVLSVGDESGIGPEIILKALSSKKIPKNIDYILVGSKIKFPSISVGATENALLAAFGAKGKTTLLNCAVEPEILDLIAFLKKLGSRIKISGRKIILESMISKKETVKHKIIFDRIEAGTYLIAGALIGKKIILKNINTKILKIEIDTLRQMGVKISITKNSISILRSKNLKKINISTKPYPGFPTDLQAQLMVLMTQASGLSKIQENIFENRFMHVPELKRMGAKIEIKNKSAYISGPTKLTGAEVMATDLRASVSLVLAGLIAENKYPLFWYRLVKSSPSGFVWSAILFLKRTPL